MKRPPSCHPGVIPAPRTDLLMCCFLPLSNDGLEVSILPFQTFDDSEMQKLSEKQKVSVYLKQNYYNLE